MSTRPGAAKPAARQAARERLRALDADARRDASARICAHIAAREGELREAAARVGGGEAVAMLYLPLPGEVDVEPVARRWLGAGWTVCFPRVDWGSGAMEAAAVSGVGGLASELEVSEHGVRVPGAGCRGVAIERVGLVLAPGLAFDTRGGRLGRGGGFYDRFLSRLTIGARVIGAAFAAQVVERVPIEAHDRVMDAVVTEQGWWAGGVGPTD